MQDILGHLNDVAVARELVQDLLAGTARRRTPRPLRPWEPAK